MINSTFSSIINIFTDKYHLFFIFIIKYCRIILIIVYKMNIKTNLLEKYVNFVDNTKKQNKNSRICTIILVFILIRLTIIKQPLTDLYNYMCIYT